MFEQVFKNIDDILHKDAGCSSELDYVEQTSWVLFLKYLDDLEKDRKTQAELSGKNYDEIIQKQFSWGVWAAPKDKDGKIDHHKALTGDDLRDFVDQKLFPYLKKFRVDASSADTLEYKIGEVFSELKNKIQSGYNMREIINRIDALRFRTHVEKHEMSHLYEGKIQNMGNAGRNGGEYYTPRPLIRTIIKVVDPELGNKIYDGASGSAGFLCEAFDFLKEKYKQRSVKEDTILQTKTFYGKEKKSLAYVIGIMNMILHGIDAPNIIHTNTLAENLADIQEKDRVDVILANMPFGGKERSEVQQNFPIKTSETASLFLQHFIKILKAGGKAGIVIKNTFLNNPDNASIAIRKLILSSCNLHTVLILPAGTFTGAQGVKTVVLFFEKGSSTKKVWFYQLNLQRNLGKTNPLNENDLKEFIEMQKKKSICANSWIVRLDEIDSKTFELPVKHPNSNDRLFIRETDLIKEELKKALINSSNLFNRINLQLESIFTELTNKYPIVEIKDVCQVIAGQSPEGRYFNKNGVGLPFYQGKKEFTNRNIGEPTTWTSKITKQAVEGDILMSVRAPVGPVNFATQNICIGRGLAAIRASKKIDKEYLFYYFLKHEDEIVGKEGMGFNSINKSQIEKLRIPIPPINIQKSIVKSLNEITNNLESLELIQKQNHELTLELKKSIFKKAFSGDN